MASLTNRFTYDVFLSFRGEDTRYAFTGNLRKALSDRGIRIFFDEDDLQKGKELTPSLMKAIEESRMAIVVLSENYASSSFCLQELSKILDCIKEKGRLVWPIFYKVDPSDVRKLKGTYGKEMDLHEKEYNDNKLQKWKNALNQVAQLSGFHYKDGDGYEHEFIEKIIEKVSKEIRPISLYVADYLVGLESQKQNVVSLLNIGFKERFHMVGIHGIGGIGKTTLAKVVFNLIVDQFQASCFLENVRENSKKNGLLYIQKIILSKLGEEKNFELTCVPQGISMLSKMLQQKKVLLILDDVDKEEQLDAMVGKGNWFNPESRVIVTTRDKGLLTCHGVGSTYEMKELNKKDSFQLLKLKAFQMKGVSSGYEDVLKRAVTYAAGLPLALEVIGSHLVNKTTEQCNFALDRYERIPNDTIQTILKLSYDALEKVEKNVFLYIACCFKGYQLEKVEKILHAHHGDNMKHPISVLVEKSLIKITELGNVMLHDLIEEMGKEIVRQDAPNNLGERCILWRPQDIVEVLEDNTGTKKVEIIHVDFGFESEITVNWDGLAFKKMKNLRTLIIKGGKFSKSSKYLPNSLRVLELMQLPFWRLPPEFYPKKLAICILSCDYISSGWGNFYMKEFLNMKALDFHNNSFLTRIPDISGLLNIEEFSVQHCKNLIAIDGSMGFLGKLKILRINYCPMLKSIPHLNLGSLEKLNLESCPNLESFPLVEDGSLNKLKILRISNCMKLKSIPSLKLASLEELHLEQCGSLENLPTMMDGAPSLPSTEELDLSFCINLESLLPVVGRSTEKLKILTFIGCENLKIIPPLNIASLEELKLEDVSLESLSPMMDGTMDKLKFLWVRYCKRLSSIPPLNLVSLEKLYLEYCVNLKSFPPMMDGSLGKLKMLSFMGCENLTSIGPLSLPFLEILDLSLCESLESFSLVIEKLKIFRAKSCKKLINISSINLATLQEFDLSGCRSLKSLPLVLNGLPEKFNIFIIEHCLKFKSIPPAMLLDLLKEFELSRCGKFASDCGLAHGSAHGIVVVSKTTKSTIKDTKLLFPKQDKGKEKVSPMQYAQAELLCLSKQSLSAESLAISLKWFSNMKELYLSENDFTFLPKCIENFHFLWKLVLDNCKKLKKINGIPPSLRSLSAYNCKELISSIKSKLLIQELHEAGNTWFCVPEAMTPDWFEYQCMAQSSITFWCRNKFPWIALCVVSPLNWTRPQFKVRVIINDCTFFYRVDWFNYTSKRECYHLHIFHMQMEKFNDNPEKALYENMWNHAKVDFGFPFQQCGIHVLKDKSSMEDIRFTDPEKDVITNQETDNITEIIGESMEDID